MVQLRFAGVRVNGARTTLVLDLTGPDSATLGIVEEGKLACVRAR
jgi:hypothetical protein